MAVKKRVDFFTSEEGIEVKNMLIAMTEDTSYNTKASYVADGEKYPGNLLPFVQKHMDFLNKHPDIEPRSYLSNLRLMTRIR